MVSGKYSALAGAISRDQAINNIAANLANVSTTGYKKAMVSFESLLKGEKQRTDAEGINYSRVGKSSTDFSAGPLKETGNPLDVAIHGEGFFKVMGSDGVRYTRRGDLVIDQNNILRTRSGLSVLDDANGEIIIAGAQSGRVSINNQGGITLTTPEGGEAVAGQLGIVNVNNPELLQREDETSFSLKNGGQEVAIDEPVIVSESLESSNVNMVEEMTDMINSYRTFETYHKVIQSYSDISDKQKELGTIS